MKDGGCHPTEDALLVLALFLVYPSPVRWPLDRAMQYLFLCK